MKQEKEGNKGKEHNIRIKELSDSLKRNNIRITGVPGDKQREKGVEGL